ncbi:MAG: hypothetical protein A2857_01260 [Candidatus Levybacteria bacterium RIFCSPHIGHO2_01_FULL_36_15]|nr:MAG: hypothetical protein A2857_01260 [Candidatus Levybacteria bacterium RIFCSPHIGHO2_01_FULL_36_15]
MDKYIEGYNVPKNFALIAQKVIVSNDKGQILLLRRSEKCRDAGKWSLPGGGLEKEDPIQGIVREAKEETGLDIVDVRPIHVVSFMEGGKFVVMIGYIAKTKSKNISLNWEHDQFKWVLKEKLLNSNLPDILKSFIERATDK